MLKIVLIYSAFAVMLTLLLGYFGFSANIITPALLFNYLFSLLITLGSHHLKRKKRLNANVLLFFIMFKMLVALVFLFVMSRCYYDMKTFVTVFFIFYFLYSTLSIWYISHFMNKD